MHGLYNVLSNVINFNVDVLRYYYNVCWVLIVKLLIFMVLLMYLKL